MSDVTTSLDDARARLRLRQGVLARFLADSDYEARLRRDPAQVAAEAGAPEAFVSWLATLPQERVRAFRCTQHMKREQAAAKEAK